MQKKIKKLNRLDNIIITKHETSVDWCGRSLYMGQVSYYVSHGHYLCCSALISVIYIYQLVDGDVMRSVIGWCTFRMELPKASRHVAAGRSSVSLPALLPLFCKRLVCRFGWIYIIITLEVQTLSIQVSRDEYMGRYITGLDAHPLLLFGLKTKSCKNGIFRKYFF